MSMPDPADPIDPTPIPPPETDSSSHASSTGLPSNVAAALACFPLIGGIIFYILEKRDSFVRFYAMQSIIFGLACILINIGGGIVYGLFSVLPAVGWLFAGLWNIAWWLVNLALFVVFVVSTVKALSGVRWEIPYIGPIARKQAEGSAG